MRRLMSVTLALLAGLCACEKNGNGPTPNPTPLSAGTWTWIAGGDILNRAGIYGIKGTADPSNVPGARSSAVSWMDGEGNYWTFGGHGVDSGWGFADLNDLWKYDTATGEWTWMSGSDRAGESGIYGTQGVAAPLNVPGARQTAASWLDAQGNLWLFGGVGKDGAGDWGQLNDLWKFDSASHEWTWVGGSNTPNQPGVYGVRGVADPSNVPGSKHLVSSWVDASGKFWLFGGFGFISPGNYGYFNDLWKYDPSTLEWTWISGSNTDNQGGVYGTRGIPSQSNVPGPRGGAASWIDSGGNIWLFGGAFHDSDGHFFGNNDLWKFDPATLEWTWVSGSNQSNRTGLYGTRGVPDPTNAPGAREGAASWIDASGKFWIFGGFGYDLAGDTGWLNDLWQFDPATREWAWVSGSNVYGQNGVYGTRGLANPADVPGARRDVVPRLDASGRLWLFGGLSYDSTGTQGAINDLWRYTR